MDLKRITDKEMVTMEHLGLFTATENADGKWTAEPNHRFVRRDFPVYDWDEIAEVFCPRSPLPEGTQDA